MTRTEYRKARRLCRENGRYALLWLTDEQAAVMTRVMFAQPTDHLAERADIIAWCKREGFECTPRHTHKASHEMLDRLSASHEVRTRCLVA